MNCPERNFRLLATSREISALALSQAGMLPASRNSLYDTEEKVSIQA
jgi:hypothetical protein